MAYDIYAVIVPVVGSIYGSTKLLDFKQRQMRSWPGPFLCYTIPFRRNPLTLLLIGDLNSSITLFSLMSDYLIILLCNYLPFEIMQLAFRKIKFELSPSTNLFNYCMLPACSCLKYSEVLNINSVHKNLLL